METETHIKTVKGKLVLVPSLSLLKQHLPKSNGPVDGQLLRKSLLADSEAVMVCPVTLRRLFKLLDLDVVKPK
jgi:hypothetical protein